MESLEAPLVIRAYQKMDGVHPSGTLVCIEPQRVRVSAEHSPVSDKRVMDVLCAMTRRYYPLERFLVGLREPGTDSFAVLEGAEICLAAALGIRQGQLPPNMKLPLLVVDEDDIGLSSVAQVFRIHSRTIAASASFADTMLFLAHLRDAFHMERYHLDCRPFCSRTWAEVRAWVREHEAELQSQTDWFLGHKDLSVMFEILTNIRSWHMDRYGRVSGDENTDAEPDTRLWDAFMAASGLAWPVVLQTPGLLRRPGGQASGILTQQMLSVPYFLNMSKEEYFKDYGIDPLVLRMCSTSSGSSVFEKILFLSTLASFSLSADPRAASSYSRRTTKRSRADLAPEGYTPGRKHSHRIAVAISSVYRGWDISARILGFAGLEEMIAPYILFEEAQCSFIVLTKHGDGMAPLRQCVYLLHGMGAQRSKSNVAPCASARGPVVDGQMRGAAARFFEDIRECAFDPFLYSEDADTPQTFLALRSFLPVQASPRGNPHNWTAQGAGVPERILKFLAAELGALGGSALIAKEESCPSDASLPLSDQGMGSADQSDDGHCSGDGPEVPRPEHTDSVTNAQRIVEGSLRNIIRTYNCSFKEFIRAVKSDPRESLKALAGNVQLVLTDPPYGTRKSRNKVNSIHDSELSSDEITEAVSIIHLLMRKGGHCILFCSMSQFEVWRQEFMRYDDMLVDCMPLFLVKEPRAYSQMPYRKHTGLMNMAEIALHCCKKGAGSAALRMVTYKSFNAVPSRFPGWCNVIDNVPNLASGEAVRDDSSRLGGRAAHMRCEQKSISLMVELVSRFSLPADIVVDLFSGTYTTAVACLRHSIGHYRNFFGCELDAICHHASKPRLLEEYSAQVLRGAFGFCQESSIYQAAEFIIHRGGSRPRQWRAPDGLPACCKLPQTLLLFLSTLWGDRSAIATLQDVPVDQWPSEQLELLNRMDPDVLRAVDAMNHQVIVGDSTIPDAGQGLFSTCRRKAGDVIGWYNGAIVYRDISSPTGVYGSGIMAVTSDRFKKFGISVDSEEVVIRERRASSIYIVPPEFCVFTKVNDARYSSRKDRASRPRSDPGRSVNVKFDVRTPATCVEMLTDPYFISITACRDIEAGEELFVDYGKNYAYV
jgi:hypothetical protein